MEDVQASVLGYLELHSHGLVLTLRFECSLPLSNASLWVVSPSPGFLPLGPGNPYFLSLQGHLFWTLCRTGIVVVNFLKNAPTLCPEWLLGAHPTGSRASVSPGAGRNPEIPGPALAPHPASQVSVCGACSRP